MNERTLLFDFVAWLTENRLLTKRRVTVDDCAQMVDAFTADKPYTFQTHETHGKEGIS